MSVVAYAGTSSFTYNFIHMIDCGTKTISSNSKSLKYCCTTTTNKSKYGTFSIKVYKIKFFGSNEFIESKDVNCKIGSGKKSVTSTVKFTGLSSNTKYDVQFWKGSDGKSIIGSGTLTY